VSETDVILAAARLLVEYETVGRALNVLQKQDYSEETKLDIAFWIGTLNTASMATMSPQRFEETLKLTHVVAAMLAMEQKEE